MATDYRLDPFQDVLNTVNISGETRTIPSVSPFSIRLAEVPLKETPSSISLTIGGYTATEVSSQPAAGEFWPDYSTGADGDENWNTGTILFNASDAGKAVVVAYKGTGMLVDTRLGTELFTASGTITAPFGATKALVSGCAGGGGGGGSYGSTASRASGGGAGASVVNYVVSVVGGNTYSITIGTGGTGGQYGGYQGTSGGITSFGSLLSLSGGTGGQGTSSPGAAGSSPNGGALCVAAQAGADGGKGGSTPWGNGGTSPSSTGVGGNGTGYGSGGAGAYSSTNVDRAGGKGTNGLLIIKWVA